MNVTIFHGGKHYDAECPDGVANFLDLPELAGLLLTPPISLLPNRQIDGFRNTEPGT